jgi:hypothetical protein
MNLVVHTEMTILDQFLTLFPNIFVMLFITKALVQNPSAVKSWTTPLWNSGSGQNTLNIFAHTIKLYENTIWKIIKIFGVFESPNEVNKVPDCIIINTYLKKDTYKQQLS